MSPRSLTAAVSVGVAFTLALALTLPLGLSAATKSDIASTKHNLSASGPVSVKATSESEICVFCHTPHAANVASPVPLWNKELSGATYIPYSSTSIQATDTGASLEPGSTSKLCLSCHDGTLAIGAVSNAPGSGTGGGTIAMTGTGTGGVMPPGSVGLLSGFTRNLGTDLTNDHPIAITYDSDLAIADGELRNPATTDHLGNRSTGVKPLVPLIADQVECVSCHDPHITAASGSDNIKFLRLNRFQVGTPGGGAFNTTNDIICLACHDKDAGGAEWSKSAHADPLVADEIYLAASATERDFPAGITVAEASCLNCHDTHTVNGSRRLLREGVDSGGNSLIPLSTGIGATAAIETTCYQCHSGTGSILSSVSQVPDIKSEFAMTYTMPITDGDQQNAETVSHNILDADFTESQASLGKSSSGGSLTNRHVECTDCHNPHRLIKNSLFNGSGSSSYAHHDHAAGHTNIASGALRGAWGVEPNYTTTTWLAQPTSFTVKQGDGGPSATTTVGNGFVTREYQICLKCHSNYGYDDGGAYPTDSSRPLLRTNAAGGGTPPGTNGLNQYTNQAAELNVDPAANSGEPGGNHTSWHPVMAATGRTLAARGGASSSLWRSPWANDIGTQTMYCSDCHGSNSGSGTSVPASGVYGPHGSNNPFLLRGTWTAAVTQSDTSAICMKCHDPTSGVSGFCCEKDDNLHAYHATKTSLTCSRCHAAVPHGWKNKALLVNLNSVGPEAGQPAGTNMSGATTRRTLPPYYNDAALRVNTWRSSGSWGANDCGPTSGTVGRDWMTNTC